MSNGLTHARFPRRESQGAKAKSLETVRASSELKVNIDGHLIYDQQIEFGVCRRAALRLSASVGGRYVQCARGWRIVQVL
jgi:hypothetical protein